MRQQSAEAKDKAEKALVKDWQTEGIAPKEGFSRAMKAAEALGLLGKGGLLLLTSYPNRTSVVLRGAYVLDTLIGTPPSAPPPGVEIDLDSKIPGEAPKTVRMKMEAHRVIGGEHGLLALCGRQLVFPLELAALGGEIEAAGVDEPELPFIAVVVRLQRDAVLGGLPFDAHLHRAQSRTRPAGRVGNLR